MSAGLVDRVDQGLGAMRRGRAQQQRPGKSPGWAGIEENSDETAVVISRQICGHPMTGDDVITDELYEGGPAVRHEMFGAKGAEAQVAVHRRGALANGVTPMEIRELPLQTHLYSGIPAMVDGFATASRVLGDDLTMED